MIDGRELPVKAGEECLSPGFFRKRPQGVISLKEIEPGDWSHGATSIVILANRLHQTDRVDRYSGILQNFTSLVEGELTKSVSARCNQHNSLPAFDVFHPVGGIGDGVKHVRLGERRNAQP